MSSEDGQKPADIHGHTSKRVAGMSDKEREDVARKLAGRRGGAPALAPPIRTTPGADAGEAARAELAARLNAELSRTERRLDRLDRFSAKSRYQMGSGSGPTGRYARLERRAERLERQLRSLG